jgi:hypothetical protein
MQRARESVAVNLEQIPSLTARQLRECSVVPHQPVLIALAVRMRVPQAIRWLRP